MDLRKFQGIQIAVSLATGALLVLVATSIGCNAVAAKEPSPLARVDYLVERPFIMNMSTTREIRLRLTFNKDLIQSKGADNVAVSFNSTTISPQFSVLNLNNSSSKITIKKSLLQASKFSHEAVIQLDATYIGHAILQPVSIEYFGGVNLNTNTTISLLENGVSDQLGLHVIIVPNEGIWGTIFIVSVSIFIVVSYINLGAQLDVENVREIIKKPKTVILGFLITVLVMPLLSWVAGQWLLGDQPLFRMGSYIFACGPTAAASTLWAVVFDSDMELSVGLQVASTIGALITMPILLYIMETAMRFGGNSQYAIKVPYMRLSQTLLVLLVALFIGWRFVGRNERAQKISKKIFRPLTFTVLLFIIIFSSIIYWYIYKMFDWTITLDSFIITTGTFLITGLLGHLISCNKSHAIAISISSTYKNSGIAFAVLVVAFEAPDTYIAYVSCLTQVVTTSLMLYLIYCPLFIINYIRRRDQPAPIQASTGPPDDKSANTTKTIKKQPQQPVKESRSGSGASDKSNNSDELIAMNVTDINVPGSPVTNQTKATEPQLGEPKLGQLPAERRMADG